MPQIPVYESQVSAGPVPKTPEATPDDFGAATSKAIVGATQAGLDLADTMIQARHAAETSRGSAEATQWFSTTLQKADDDSNPATLPARFEKQVADRRAEYQAMGRGAFRDGALQVFDTLGQISAAQVRNNAAKREIAQHQSELDSASDSYIGQAAAAPNDLQRQTYVNLAKTSVARANAAGYISKDDALARLRALPGRIEEQQVEGLIARDPAAAVAALDDKQRFPNLDPAVRDLQRGKATLAQQKASFATVSAVQQGIADGTKTQFDVDRLLEDGAIGQATRDWLYEQVKKATQERAEKADGQKRVDTALRDGGKLDAKKPKDQAAVDAHYDAVVAPANPDAATLARYVGKTGMVPTKLGQRIRGGLASDDPQQVVNAASLIGELGKSDAKLAEGFGTKRTRYAKAVMDGIDGELAPERAVELATKRLGQPDASDDDGTQIADAEGGAANDGEKAKSDEAGDGSKKEAGAEKGDGQRAQDQTHFDEAKDGGASDTRDDSADVGAATTGTTGETVGPEIAPISDIEATGDAGRISVFGESSQTSDASFFGRYLDTFLGKDRYARTHTPAPPPGMKFYELLRYGNWTGGGFSGGRTSPPFLPLTEADKRVKPIEDADGKPDWLDTLSKPHDIAFDDAQQTVLKELLDFTKPARQVIGDYYSKLAKADHEFLEKAKPGMQDLIRYNHSRRDSDLGHLPKDPWARFIFSAATFVFPDTASRNEDLANIIYNYKSPYLHEQNDSPELADAKLRLRWMSEVVDRQVVGRPVESVLNKLRSRVSELGGDPDMVTNGAQPAAYVDNPEDIEKQFMSFSDSDTTYRMLSDEAGTWP